MSSNVIAMLDLAVFLEHDCLILKGIRCMALAKNLHRVYYFLKSY